MENCKLKQFVWAHFVSKKRPGCFSELVLCNPVLANVGKISHPVLSVQVLVRAQGTSKHATRL